MSLYLDASVLVPLFIQDALTERARSTLRAHADFVTVSDWTVAESASAMGRAVRTRVLTREAAHQALRAIDAWLDRAPRRVELLPSDVREAETLLRTFETTLKTPDALHLVIARRMGLTLLSFDSALARDAAALGVPVVL